MRKPIIISALPPLLISLTALLWLLWGFVPLATAIKWLITAGMLAVVCRTLWIMRQRNIPLPEAAA
ncbi:hypothetical protein [Cronobacter malonaticus]|nr:hypothetical protein [Cronobacter malonaticus]